MASLQTRGSSAALPSTTLAAVRQVASHTHGHPRHNPPTDTDSHQQGRVLAAVAALEEGGATEVHSNADVAEHHPSPPLTAHSATPQEGTPDADAVPTAHAALVDRIYKELLSGVDLGPEVGTPPSTGGQDAEGLTRADSAGSMKQTPPSRGVSSALPLPCTAAGASFASGTPVEVDAVVRPKEAGDSGVGGVHNPGVSVRPVRQIKSPPGVALQRAQVREVAVDAREREKRKWEARLRAAAKRKRQQEETARLTAEVHVLQGAVLQLQAVVGVVPGGGGGGGGWGAVTGPPPQMSPIAQRTPPVLQHRLQGGGGGGSTPQVYRV